MLFKIFKTFFRKILILRNIWVWSKYHGADGSCYRYEAHCAFHLVEIFDLHIVYIFKKAWNFLTKFCYSDQMFMRNISEFKIWPRQRELVSGWRTAHVCGYPLLSSDVLITLIYLKAETSAHVQIAITRLYILFANILTWHNLETYTGDTPSKIWSQDVICMWSRDFSWDFLRCVQLLRNFNIQASHKVDIWA